MTLVLTLLSRRTSSIVLFFLLSFSIVRTSYEIDQVLQSEFPICKDDFASSNAQRTTEFHVSCTNDPISFHLFDMRYG